MGDSSQTVLKDTQYDVFKQSMVYLRECIVCGVIFMFFKLAYFLSLIDDISPLIDIVYRIFYDIGYFLFILFSTGFAFAYSFYLIAQNQKNFDSLTEYDVTKRKIIYDSVTGSMWYMINLLLGQTDTAPFSSGDASQDAFLKLIFALAAFIIMIHLLNMLIAIMGNTYSQRRDQEDALRYKDHLRFVLDNFHMRESAFKNMKRVKYIIAAFTMDDENQESEVLSSLEDQISQVQLDVLHNHKRTALRMQMIKEMVFNMIRRLDIGEEEYQRIKHEEHE